MLRRTAQVRRFTDEPYVDWTRRATAKALQAACSAGIRDWVHAHYEKKWAWAGYVTRRPADSLTYRVLSWRDSLWCSLAADFGRRVVVRPSRRRWAKYEDALRRFCRDQGLEQWMELAH